MRAPHLHAELDPSTQISGFQEIETHELRPDLGGRPSSALRRVNVGQIGTRLSAVRLRRVLSDRSRLSRLGLRSGGPPQVCGHRMASAVSLRQSIASELNFQSSCALEVCNSVGCSRTGRPARFAGFRAVLRRARLACLHFGRTISIFINENNSARNHLRRYPGHPLRDGRPRLTSP